MRVDFLDKYPLSNGVYLLSEINDEFESEYLEVRKQENRIYSDEELKNLPYATTNNPHLAEWKLRIQSFERIRSYIKLKKNKLEILDLGCGNGWFCGQLSKILSHNYYCVDVNLKELEQANRVFNSDKINFIYADVFTTEIPDSLFNLIAINAAIQYFPDLNRLVEKLFRLLNDNGEIHIIDSPFYTEENVEAAKKRTSDYYKSLGFPEMTKNYFHHSLDELSAFKYDVLFDPQSTFNKLRKLFLHKDSPFPWIRIKK